MDMASLATLAKHQPLLFTETFDADDRRIARDDTGYLRRVDRTRCSAIAERPRCRMRYSFRHK